MKTTPAQKPQSRPFHKRPQNTGLPKHVYTQVAIIEDQNATLLAALQKAESAMAKMDAFLEDVRKSNPGWLGNLVLQRYDIMNEAFYESERALPAARAAIARATQPA